MKRILYLLSFMFTIQNAMSWGTEGHQIVAQIAEDQLSINAKKAVDTLLQKQTMASVANWADVVKNKPEFANTKGWHFADIPDGQTYESIPHTPEGDVVTATNQMVQVLKSPTSTTLQKQQALMFVIHFMGDVHQPLHVGRPTDRGGNSVSVIFGNKKMNLHSLWDSGLIDTQKMDYIVYARSLAARSFLNETVTPGDVPFNLIISEDMAARNQIYMFNSSIDEAITLDMSYLNKNLSTMNSRLLLGGKRLAELLNKIFI